MTRIVQTTVKSKALAAGTHEYGFGGEVPASELWTGDALAALLGVTQGTAQNINEPYLKWFVDGKVILKSKKSIRYSASWTHLNEKSVVYGDKIVQDKYGNQYKVRLMKGTLTDPAKDGDPDRGAKGSEWNRLMLPIHEQVKNKNWSHPAYVEPEIPSDWGIDYINADLGFVNANGCNHWCQERSATISGYRMFRGSTNGPSLSGHNTAGYTNYYCGWSPVLELIKPKPKLLLRHTKTGKIYTIKEGSFS